MRKGACIFLPPNPTLLPTWLKFCSDARSLRDLWAGFLHDSKMAQKPETILALVLEHDLHDAFQKRVSWSIIDSSTAFPRKDSLMSLQ